MPQKRAPVDDVLSAAERMSKALHTHRPALRAARIDVTRIDTLRKEARRLAKEYRVAYAGMADRAVPTRRLAELMKTARLDLRILDALVQANKELVPNAWKSAIKVKKRIGRPKKRTPRVISPAPLS